MDIFACDTLYNPQGSAKFIDPCRGTCHAQFKEDFCICSCYIILYIFFTMACSIISFGIWLKKKPVQKMCFAARRFIESFTLTETKWRSRFCLLSAFSVPSLVVVSPKIDSLIILSAKFNEHSNKFNNISSKMKLVIYSWVLTVWQLCYKALLRWCKVSILNMLSSLLRNVRLHMLSSRHIELFA